MLCKTTFCYTYTNIQIRCLINIVLHLIEIIIINEQVTLCVITFFIPDDNIVLYQNVNKKLHVSYLPTKLQ